MITEGITGRRRPKRSAPPRFGAALFPLFLLMISQAMSGCGDGGSGTSTTSLDPPATEPDAPGDVPAFPFVDSLDQANVTNGAVKFDELFIIGDELFEVAFSGLDGVGIATLPDGTPLPRRFSRIPPGGGRETGPNGQACVSCHNTPFATSAGEAAGNVVQDPAGLGVPPFNFRNPISLFGSGVPQRLAEEITEDLLAILDSTAADAVAGGPPVLRALVSKGISFGEISATRDADGVVDFDLSAVEGIDPDLVVRPYGWKGNVTTLRSFVRGAARNELGMEADELVAKDPQMQSDPDGDGVENELSVGDITAITIYVAAQEIPTTIHRLVGDGLIPPPPLANSQAAALGAILFEESGCATCHIPELPLDDPVFEEPTLRGGGNYFDADIDVEDSDLDPDLPFRFDLLLEGDRPRLVSDGGGGARVALFGDLKRHNMGSELADSQATASLAANDEQLEVDGVPIAVDEAFFLTPELWGVGNTGPWLHDGRAATLTEAILLHGVDNPAPVGHPDRSEAQEARDAFVDLTEDDAAAVVEFLKSLVLFEAEEEEE